MSIQITPVTLADSIALDAYLAASVALHERETPAFPPPTRQQLERTMEFPWPGGRDEPYVATADGEPVGFLSISFPTEDNLQKAHFEIGVVPEHRRRGYGTQLLTFAQERARANDRAVVNTHSTWTMPGIPAADETGPAFARAMGYRDALPEVNRVLKLDTVDEAVLDQMLAHGWARAGGYRLVRWNDPMPEEFVHDIAYLEGRLISDAPMGDTGWEPMNIDADRVRRTEAVVINRGRSSFHTAAMHEESGRVVAWTTITTEDDCPWHAWQQITIVDPDHRGHRLGAVVKVANLRWFREQNPDVTAVNTFNAAENSYMISINEQMGFRPQYAFQNWRRDL
jgi:GNAT superfamily N-acetyltransferase